MSTLQINKGTLPSRVCVPTSKSYANRALILAATKKTSVTINNLPEATDVTFMVKALKKVGLDISQDKSGLTIANSFPECETSDITIDAGEGGTTARFLAAFLLLGKKRYVLKLGKRLKDRPWSEFINTAKSLGAFAELKDELLTLQGPISGPAVLEVDCSRTTQFATSFGLTLKGTKIVPVHMNSSLSYWNMNEPLKKHFLKNDLYDVPADWSSASYPVTYAVLNHEIEFPGLAHDPYQADSKLFSVIDKLGGLNATASGITVTPVSRKMNLDLDMSDCLDLFPALCFLVSHIEGAHRLSGLANLVHKESDRLSEVCRLLTVFERHYELNGEVLTIKGNEKICGVRHLELPDDHRIVMTGALFLRHHQGGTLSNSESVNKSYPGFFDLLK